MTDAQRQAVAELRAAGYAIAIWSPEELGEARADRLESRVVELGNEVLGDMQ